MYRQAFIMSGRSARDSARASGAAAASSKVPESVTRLSDDLVGNPSLASHELVILRKLRTGSSYEEIVTTMRQLMSSPKNDTVVGDALRKIVETLEDTGAGAERGGEGEARKAAVLDKMFAAFERGPSPPPPPSPAESAPRPVDVLQRILAPDGPPIADAADAAERYAGKVVETLTEAFAIFETRDAPVPQARIAANNARAHILNELMPPRWPDLFRIVWRRVCGTPIAAPDPEMDEQRIIDTFVNVSPEDVEKMENLPQGSAEWLAARRFRVSGSTVASLVNLSPYASYDEWLVDKLFQFTYSNAAMRHGSITEAVARDYFVHAMAILGCRNISVVERGFMINPEMGGWAGASPDGLVDLGDGGDRRAILEIKCPFYDKKSFYSEREKYDQNPWGIPEQYYCQIQYLMHLLGYKFSYFVVHLPHRTQIMLFVYNPPFAQALYDAAKEVFFSKFIPTAARYFRGELPFGHIEPPAEDVLDLRVAAKPPLLVAKRRVAGAKASRPEEESASSPEEKRRREADERRRLHIEERIENHIRRLGVRNEFDRYKWTISISNASVEELWGILEDCETDVEREAFHATLRLLPRYAIEDSERGKALCGAFLQAMETSAVRTAGFLAEFGAAASADLLSVASCPFEETNPERERKLLEGLLSVSGAAEATRETQVMEGVSSGPGSGPGPGSGDAEFWKMAASLPEYCLEDSDRGRAFKSAFEMASQRNLPETVRVIEEFRREDPSGEGSNPEREMCLLQELTAIVGSD